MPCPDATPPRSSIISAACMLTASAAFLSLCSIAVEGGICRKNSIKNSIFGWRSFWSRIRLANKILYDYFEAFSIIPYRLATHGQFATTWTKRPSCINELLKMPFSQEKKRQNTLCFYCGLQIRRIQLTKVFGEYCETRCTKHAWLIATTSSIA